MAQLFLKTEGQGLGVSYV